MEFKSPPIAIVLISISVSWTSKKLSPAPDTRIKRGGFSVNLSALSWYFRQSSNEVTHHKSAENFDRNDFRFPACPVLPNPL